MPHPSPVSRQPIREANRPVIFALVIYLLLGLVIGWWIHPIRFDDPFITYRYAYNLTAGLGFRFNPDEATLITTAPLYALLLALARILGADIPTASVIIGMVSLVMAAWTLTLLGHRHEHTRVGFIAGLMTLFFPLMWLTLGFETPLFIAIALFTFLAVDCKQYFLAGLGAGITLGLRGDGAIVLAVAAFFSLDWSALFQSWRSTGRINLRSMGVINAVRLVLVALLVYLPLAIWLTTQFGSPIPSTLLTKSAQASSGLTGFYPFTTYLQGATLLAQALFEQSPLLIFFLLACMVGAAYSMLRGLAGFAMPLVWSIAHLAGYSLLGVSPYTWYYAPAIPGFVALAAYGVDALARGLPTRVSFRVVVSYGLVGVILAGLCFADIPILMVTSGATPPPPSELRAKLLPEVKTDVYARVGKWVRDNTPPDTTLGVTELGVMSYYANRRAVDFLGLTQPQNLEAIRHGDYLQTLLREQPDYIALNSLNAIYDYDPQRASWFTALYTPVVTFDDMRFWGSPMVIWQRTGNVISTPTTLDTTPHDLGEGWQVVSIQTNAVTITAGSPTLLRLRVRAGNNVGTRTLQVQPILIKGGDGLPVSSRLIYTNQWKTGEQGWVDFPIMPQPIPPIGGYVIQTRWQEGGPPVKAGNLKVSLGVKPSTDAALAPLSRGVGVEVFTQVLSACVGSTIPLTLTWRGGEMDGKSYTVFVQLRSGQTVVASADGLPMQGTYPTTIWSPNELIPDVHSMVLGTNITAGDYALVVGLYVPEDNSRWSVEPSANRTPDGGVKIADVHVRNCP